MNKETEKLQNKAYIAQLITSSSLVLRKASWLTVRCLRQKSTTSCMSTYRKHAALCIRQFVQFLFVIIFLKSLPNTAYLYLKKGFSLSKFTADLVCWSVLNCENNNNDHEILVYFVEKF